MIESCVILAMASGISCVWYIVGRTVGKRYALREGSTREAAAITKELAVYGAAVDEALLLLPQDARVAVASCIESSYAARINVRRVVLRTREDRGGTMVGADGTLRESKAR